MNECAEHSLHEHRIRALEEQMAADRAAVEENARALEVNDARMEPVIKSLEELERKADEADGAPARILDAWKLALVAAVASILAGAVFASLAGR